MTTVASLGTGAVSRRAAACATPSWHWGLAAGFGVQPATAQQTQRSRAQPCCSAGTSTKASAAVRRISAARMLRESTLVSQCQRDAMAPGSQTRIARSPDLSLALPVISRLRGTKVGDGCLKPYPVLTHRGACTLGARCAVLRASRDEVGSLYAALTLVLPRWQCIREDPSR